MTRFLIDAHLDLAWNALGFDRDLTLPLEAQRRAEAHMTDARCRGRGTTSLPELRRAGVGVCVATLLARAGRGFERPSGGYGRSDVDHGHPAMAHSAAHAQLALYRVLERDGQLRMLRTTTELDDHVARWTADPEKTPIGFILSMEGADPILAPEACAEWWEAGLRLVGPAHYGHGRYAAGTGVDGPLTAAGESLIRELDRLGIGLDVTHLSDTSMAQALELYRGPVLASHHNCRALTPGDRQLSDDQIRTLIARDAVIGVAFDAWMLYPNWRRGETDPSVVSLQTVALHIDRVCQLAGNTRHSAIGSDLDGGFGTEQSPGDLDTIADVQRLNEILGARGYSESDLDAIFHGNWLRLFRAVLPGG